MKARGEMSYGEMLAVLMVMSWSYGNDVMDNIRRPDYQRREQYDTQGAVFTVRNVSFCIGSLLIATRAKPRRNWHRHLLCL